MKQHLSIFGRSLSMAAPFVLLVVAGAHAAPRKESAAKIKITAPVKVGDIQVEKASNRTAVGERFRLWLSVNATDCNDPALLGNGGKDDHVFELYGELRVNDKVEWKVARLNNGAAQPGLAHLDLPSSAKVDPRRQGFSLNRDPFVFQDKHEIKVDTSKGRIARLALQLFDKDDPQGGFDYKYADQNKADRKDDKIGDYKIDLDLGALGKGDGRYYWFWSSRDESGNPVGTNLYLYAEHVGTVYENTSGNLRKPQIDPKIEIRKLPGGVDGPGPVSNRPNRRKTRRIAPKPTPTPELR